MVSILKSFKYAFHGISDALKSEPNLRVHMIATLTVFVLGYFLKLNSLEFAILTITASSVIVLELVNTVVEKITDKIYPEIDEKARIIKDISAASVLLSAITSIVVGLFLFLPKIIPYFS